MIKYKIIPCEKCNLPFKSSKRYRKRCIKCSNVNRFFDKIQPKNNGKTRFIKKSRRGETQLSLNGE